MQNRPVIMNDHTNLLQLEEHIYHLDDVEVPNVYRDLYKRWVAFGMLSSHSRLHGSSSYRVPWNYDEEACEVLKAFTKLKCRLMPYLYTAAVRAHLTGIPVMRPMHMEFWQDRNCAYLDRQYMLGDSVLAAPRYIR